MVKFSVISCRKLSSMVSSKDKHCQNLIIVADTSHRIPYPDSLDKQVWEQNARRPPSRFSDFSIRATRMCVTSKVIESYQEKDPKVRSYHPFTPFHPYMLTSSVIAFITCHYLLFNYHKLIHFNCSSLTQVSLLKRKYPMPVLILCLFMYFFFLEPFFFTFSYACVTYHFTFNHFFKPLYYLLYFVSIHCPSFWLQGFFEAQSIFLPLIVYLFLLKSCFT